MSVWDPDRYNEALCFAAEAHGEQKVPGTQFSYLLHLAQVCQEAMGAVLQDPSLNGDLVMQCALLHDTIEDTEVTRDTLITRFGAAVADGVEALSKRPLGPQGHAWDKAAQMSDSLARITRQPREVWVVKLADRITNLQAPPPHWSPDKVVRYHAEAVTILDLLGSASRHLSERLSAKIEAYRVHLSHD